MGVGGGVPWFKLRPRSLGRTLDDRDQPKPLEKPSPSRKATRPFVWRTGLAGLGLAILAALLWSRFIVLSGIAAIFGLALLMVAGLDWWDRRKPN